MLGDLEPSEAFTFAKRYFDEIPAHALPPHADVSEPPQTEERRGNVEEKFGTLPALAIGYTVPPRGSKDWYAMTILDRVLHGGRARRIYRHYAIEKQFAIETDVSLNVFDANGPTQMVTRVFYRPEFSTDATVAA